MKQRTISTPLERISEEDRDNSKVSLRNEDYLVDREAPCPQGPTAASYRRLRSTQPDNRPRNDSDSSRSKSHRRSRYRQSRYKSSQDRQCIKPQSDSASKLDDNKKVLQISNVLSEGMIKRLEGLKKSRSGQESLESEVGRLNPRQQAETKPRPRSKQSAIRVSNHSTSKRKEQLPKQGDLPSSAFLKSREKQKEQQPSENQYRPSRRPSRQRSKDKEKAQLEFRIPNTRKITSRYVPNTEYFTPVSQPTVPYSKAYGRLVTFIGSGSQNQGQQFGKYQRKYNMQHTASVLRPANSVPPAHFSQNSTPAFRPTNSVPSPAYPHNTQHPVSSFRSPNSMAQIPHPHKLQLAYKYASPPPHCGQKNYDFLLQRYLGGRVQSQSQSHSQAFWHFDQGVLSREVKQKEQLRIQALQQLRERLQQRKRKQQYLMKEKFYL